MRALIAVAALMGASVLWWLLASQPAPGAASLAGPAREQSRSWPLLQAPAQRIVPAAAASADLVCALVEPGRVAALPAQVEVWALPRAGAGPWALLPRFEHYLAEPLLDLDPDLVVAHPWQSADTTARLQEAGVPVITLPDATGWHQARGQLLALGRTLGGGALTRAEALIAELDDRVSALAANAGRRAGLAVLPYTHGGAGGWTAGTGTNLDAILGLAGLRNLAAETGRSGHVRLSFEELLVLDPDLVVAGGAATASLLRSEPVLAGLRAVTAGRVVELASRQYDTTSYRMVYAAETLAAEVDAVLDRQP